MAYYFSASTLGFYLDQVHGSNMPVDVVPISDEQHRLLLEQNLNQGLQIRADGDGRPLAVRFEVSPEDAARQRIQTAMALLAASDVNVLRAYENGEPVDAAWVAYRVALRSIVAGSGAEIPPAPPKPNF